MELYRSSISISHCHCCCSVTQSSLTLCDHLDCSTQGLPVPHHLLESAQVHVCVHGIIDATQPPHPRTPSSSSALNLCQHQGLFQWVNCLHQIGNLMELQLHYWSFSVIISPSSEYSGLIFLKIDWFDLLVVQGTFRSLLQHTVRRHQLFGLPIRP